MRSRYELINKNGLLEPFIEMIPEPAVIINEDTEFLYINEAYEKFSGFSKKELFIKKLLDMTYSSDHELLLTAIKEVDKYKIKKAFEKRSIIKGNFFRIISSNLCWIDKGCFLIILRDITQEKEILKKSKEYITMLNSNIITSRTDLEGKIKEVSNIFCEISGFKKDELLGQNHRIIRHQDMKKRVFQDMWASLLSNGVWEGELKNRKKEGGFYWVKGYICSEYDISGAKIGYISIRQDITDKKYIEEISLLDALTGIHNRRFFKEFLPKVINSSKRDNSLVAFLLIDVDYFKQYNDTYGHQLGDEALIKVAKILKKYLKRADDHCFRLGGEEFGVIFKPEIKKGAIEFAQIIKNAIEDLKIKHEKSIINKYLTVSMGLVCIHARDIESTKELYKNTDKLLYLAKKNGRNRVECED